MVATAAAFTLEVSFRPKECSAPQRGWVVCEDRPRNTRARTREFKPYGRRLANISARGRQANSIMSR